MFSCFAGYRLVVEKGVLTSSIIKEIQKLLEHNSAGFRSVPGTALKRSDGVIVYTPPQDRQILHQHAVNETLYECFRV